MKKLFQIITNRNFWLFIIASTFTISLAAQNFTETNKVVAPDRAADDFFGISVAISGNYAIVGAHKDDEDAAGGNTLSQSGAVHIFKKDPVTNNWSQLIKLVASDRGVGDEFGKTVAISGDYAIVGSYFDDEDASGGNTKNNAGAAYIFKKDHGGIDNWGEVAKIVASDRNTSDLFGFSVAISGDYVIVGAREQDYNATGGAFVSNAGAAYIFKKDQGGIDNWGEVTKIVASDRGAVDIFGSTVAISGDYAIVGAHQEDHDANGGNTVNSAGSAYIFKKDQGGTDNWGEVKKIVASDRNNNDLFGSSLAISGDHIVVGANYEDEDANGGNTINEAGSAYIFGKDQGGTDNWGEVTKIVASDRGGLDRFGYAVSISGDYVAVGAYLEDEDVSGGNTLNDAGSAYIFKKDQGGTNNWGQVNKIVASDRGAIDRFGFSLAISGSDVIVGAYYEKDDVAGANPLTYAGSAYFFGAPPTDPIVNLGDATACQNENIYIPVELTNGDGVATMSFKVDFDAAELTFVGVPTSGPYAPHADISAGTFVVSSAAAAANSTDVTMSWVSGATNYGNVNFGTGPTTLFYLEFTPVASGTPNLSWITTSPYGEIVDASLATLPSTYTIGTINVNTTPTVFTFDDGAGNSIACDGATLVLSGSETGVNYQLKEGTNNVGAPLAGTGNALNFVINGAGIYTVEATNTTTNCTNTMTGSVTVTAIPTAFNVTGTDDFCPGSPKTISLSGSEVGVNYQLQRNNINEGSPVAGTGNTIDFTGLTTSNAAGDNFTVVATNATNTNCTANMNGTATLTLTCFDVTGRYVYGQTGGDVLKNFQATLKNSAGNTVATYAIQGDGTFIFEDVPNGTGYYIEVNLNALSATSKPHGGINATDALITLLHFVNIYPLTLGVKTDAGNVDAANTVVPTIHPYGVNASDALAILNRFVGNSSTFTSGDWATEYDGYGTANSSFDVNGAVNALGDVLVLAYGDVNGSYNVSSLSNGNKTNINLFAQGQLEVEESARINIPFHTQDYLSAGAVSLVVNFPYDVFEVESITLADHVAASNLRYTIENGKIRLGWFNLEPLQLEAGEELFSIQAKVHEDLTAAYNWTPTITFGDESDLGDELGNTITDVNLTVPTIVLPIQTVLKESEHYEQTIYPNPASTFTTIEYNLPQDGEVMIELVNSLGMRQQILMSQSQSAGVYLLQVNTSTLTNGNYLIKTTITTDDNTTSLLKRLMIMK
jgi:hypothetical protein